MRILGLDYGEKTIGVAVSDPRGVVACGLEIIRRADEISLKKSVSRLSEIIKEYEISTIVLGYPKNMNNTEGPRCEKTVAFKEKLLRNFKRMDIVLWDERLSTAIAVREFKQAKLSSKKVEMIIDEVAAVLILQSYLDFKNLN